jgi:hypothetical protein
MFAFKKSKYEAKIAKIRLAIFVQFLG